MPFDSKKRLVSDGVLRRHTHTLRELLDALDVGVAGDGDDDSDGVARRLRVLSSPRLTTSLEVSSTQSRPVIPRSNSPSAT